MHSEASAPTPLKLEQAYLVCELQEKVDILWSFIKSHLKVCASWVCVCGGCMGEALCGA